MQLAFHLFVTWFVWGLAYVAIAESLDGLPPFAVAGPRFVVAGIALLAIDRARNGRLALAKGNLANAALIGLLLIAIGDGAVIAAVDALPSGIVAVLIATTSLFAVLLDAWRLRARPRRRELVAMALGLAGVAALTGSGSAGAPALSGWAVAIALVGALSWAGATVLTPRLELPRPVSATGLQLLVGGLLLTALATVRGEWAALDLARLGGRPGLAIVYLIVLTSMLGFASYQWLMRHARPALATSFAFVNPVVALLAGWALRGEPLGREVLVGAPLVVVAVGLVASASAPPPEVQDAGRNRET